MNKELKRKWILPDSEDDESVCDAEERLTSIEEMFARLLTLVNK